MGHVHETNHSKNSLFVRHVAEVLRSCTVLLPSEPGFLEVLVKFFNNFCPTFGQPGSSLLLGHGEDSIVKFFPQLDPTSRDLVDWLAQLGTNGQNTASFLVIGTFPLGIGDA